VDDEFEEQTTPRSSPPCGHVPQPTTPASRRPPPTRRGHLIACTGAHPLRCATPSRRRIGYSGHESPAVVVSDKDGRNRPHGFVTCPSDSRWSRHDCRGACRRPGNRVALDGYGHLTSWGVVSGWLALSIGGGACWSCSGPGGCGRKHGHPA
jgi:hypothetical protein